MSFPRCRVVKFLCSAGDHMAMDCEAALDLADQVLAGSANHKFRSLLHDIWVPSFPLCVHGKTFIAGEATQCEGDELWLKPLAFSPGKGFHGSASVPDAVCIVMPELAARSIPVRPGVQILCCGPLTTPTRLHVYNFARSSSIHFRPEFDSTYAWECTHLFCGAFCGWSQAADWLPNAGFGFTVGRQVFVDHDETILRLCCAQQKMNMLRCPLKHNEPWNPAGRLQFWGMLRMTQFPSSTAAR